MYVFLGWDFSRHVTIIILINPTPPNTQQFTPRPSSGPTSPGALDNLTPRRRRASVAAAKLRRGSTGPAAGQRKRSPVRGAKGGGASESAAAPVVVEDEEEEGPSLFGGEPKIY